MNRKLQLGLGLRVLGVGFRMCCVWVEEVLHQSIFSKH